MEGKRKIEEIEDLGEVNRLLLNLSKNRMEQHTIKYNT